MAKQPRRLTGKVVAVTGGTRGIGLATARALARTGAKVAIGGTDTDYAKAVADEIAGQVVGFGLDVADRASFTRFLDDTEAAFGPLDILINNAGIMPIGSFVDEADDVTRRVLKVNLEGIITGSKLALQRFVPRGSGHLIQVASGAGKIALAGGATYCASKFAVVGLTESLRQELRGTGVGVSLVIPGQVDTELSAGLKGKGIASDDVAAAIIDALEYDKYEVYAPKRMGAMVRTAAIMPRVIAENLGRAMKADKLLTHADATARKEYQARLHAE